MKISTEALVLLLALADEDSEGESGAVLRLFSEEDVQLAELAMSVPAFKEAEGDLIEANEISVGLVSAAGEPSYATLVSHAGSMVCWFSVGDESSGADLVLTSVNLREGDQVRVASLSIEGVST